MKFPWTKSMLLPMLFSAFVVVTVPCDVLGETSAQPAADTWSFEIQLYALPIWIQGDAELGYERNRLTGGTVERSLAGDVDLTPDDIFSNLNMAGMAHFEARHSSGWGLWLEYAFIDLGPDVDLGSRILRIDSMGLYQGIFEAFAIYRVALEKGYIDYFGGIRWWHNALEATATVDIPGIITRTKSWKRTIDWYDPVIGARWTYPISDSWSLRVRGDIGGLGIESDFTAELEAGVLYDFNENWRLDLRFKALWVDYEEGEPGKRDRFAYETVTFGPIVGITYRF